MLSGLLGVAVCGVGIMVEVSVACVSVLRRVSRGRVERRVGPGRRPADEHEGSGLSQGGQAGPAVDETRRQRKKINYLCQKWR